MEKKKFPRRVATTHKLTISAAWVTNFTFNGWHSNFARNFGGVCGADRAALAWHNGGFRAYRKPQGLDTTGFVFT